MLGAINSGTTDRYAELLRQRKAVELQATRNQLVQQIADVGGGTPFDQEIVRGLSEAELYSPNLSSLLEEEYSKKITELQTNLINEDNGSFEESLETNPDEAYDLIDRTEWQTARNFIASNIYNGLQEKFSQAGLLNQGLAFAQQLIPFKSWISFNTAIASDTAKAFFPGDSLELQYSYLSTLPPKDVKKQLETYVNRELSTGNYLDAMTFVEGYLSFSETDKAWENIWAGVDVASVLPLGTFAKGLRGASKAVMAPSKDLERMAAAADLPAEAVKITFSDSLSKGVLPSHNIKNIGDVERILPSIMRPQELFNGRTLRAGGAATARLEQATVARAGTAMEILTDLNRVERLSPAAIERGFAEAEEFLVDNFVHVNHKIVDVKKNLAENHFGNVYSVDIQIGKTDGSAFPKELGALKAAKTIGLKTNDYKVVQIPSGGWVVQVSRYVDESSLGVRGVKIDLDHKLPDNWVTRFLGKAVGADLLLSKSQTTARGVAVQSSEQMSNLLESFSEPVSRLNKKGRKEFEEFIIRDRDHVDPKNGRGMVRLTPFDFEDAFYTQFNKLPSYDQIDAYMAFRQLYDLDWIVRDLDVFKQKAVLGIEEFGFKLKGDDGASTLTSFEGKEVVDLPRGSKNTFKIAVVDDDGNLIKGNGYNSRYMNEKDWERIRAYKDDNYKIIQAFNGSKKIGDGYYNFIMVRNFKRDAIGLNNLSYSKGSRVIQKDPWYLKQPRISAEDGRAYYRGDKSIAAFRSYEEGVEAEKILNTARRMVKNREPGVVKYFADNIPFWSIKDFMKQVKKGELSLDSPIKIVKSGSRSVDSYNILDDLRAEGTNINSFQVDNELDLSNRITGRFLGDRAEENMDAYGVEKNTIFKLEGDPIMSPLDTMRYSMSNIVDTHLIHDYRLKSTRDYTTQYSDILDGDRASFDTDGLQYIFEPHYRTGADPNRVKTAEAQRQAILSLFNNKTFVEKQVDMYKERLVRSVRKLAGDGTAKWVEDKALPAASSADVAMRGFAFHTKMGFLNIRQLFLQSTAAVNIISIAPKHGGRGAMATWPLIFSMNSRQGFVRNMAEKLKGVTTFSADEFDELSKMYRRSGFYHVGGDVAYLDNMKPPELVKGKFNTVLQIGAIPFKAGERIARTMAFATAYSERKALTEGKALNRADEAWILQRAKDLTGNMTRDSNAAYQRGYGAIATQFFGYQMRLMEQFIGTKLTNAEKARLFTGMSLMYGVPVATGMTLGVAPIREWLKDEFAKNGYEYDNTLAEPFIDGFAAQFLEFAQLGDLNVSEKFGPGGLTTFYDLLKGDAELSEILLGASGGIIGDTILDAGGAIPFIWDTLGLKEGAFKPSVTEILDVFRNISTVNNITKLWEAVHTSQWLSQNENVLTNVSIQEAISSYLFGLDPERVSDAFNKIEALSSLKDLQNNAMKEMVIDYRRGLQLKKDGFPNEAKVYFDKVLAKKVTAGLNSNQMITVFNRAIDGRPLDETVIQQYNKLIGDK